ncbi:MAG TPA: hypothetical protein VK745_02480 [Polyangiaceae bacterium]|jgi:hypothetical protein|nr:hypothetical protein [Polyangiaceae bacterium]
MLSERLQLKIYLEPSEHFELEALIPVFHRFIRDQVLKELMIDVVDYSHVPNGPGVVLIGHAADYYVGALDGALGLVYSCKRAAPEPTARLEDALRRLVNVARLLEQESTVKLRFRSDELSLRLTDRLNAPNDDASYAAAKSEVEQLFARVYSGATVSVERLVEPRGPLGLRAKSSASPALEALLEKLGGPPTS